MGFSSILDISSFFIGMIINLIFVALMCYYFKRKYDYLEVAQNEQAKILYQLIHKPVSCPAPSMDFTRDPLVNPMVDRMRDVVSINGSESESDSDDSDNDSEDGMEVMPEVHHEPLNDCTHDVEVEVIELDETKKVDLEKVQLEVEEVNLQDSMEITIQLTDHETNYSKMSMKQLKEVLSSKGIKTKNNLKKDELIELITNEIKA